MRAALLVEFGKLAIADVPDPVCGPADVIVDVRCVQPSVTECMLIDGDDIPFHSVLTRGLADGPVQFGGHEFAGVVSATGSGVAGVAVGQRVTVVESSACGECAACGKGRFDACPRPWVIGFNRPGAFAERVVVPASSVVPLPAEVTWSAGAAMQPLAGAVHADAALGVKPGESVLVIGGGVMGLLAVAVARLGNATRVALATRSERKWRLALEFGADEVFDATGGVVALADQATDGLGYDVVVETAGGSESAGLSGTSTVDTAVRAVRRGGRIAVVSVLPDRLSCRPGCCDRSR